MSDLRARAAAAANPDQTPTTASPSRELEVAQPDAEPEGLAPFIQNLAPHIERALPKHLNADRMARIVLTEVRRNPKLYQASPHSLAGAVLTAAGLGLEIDSSRGEAYLVPYENRRGGTVEAQLIVGYQGLVKLFWQHPRAVNIDAHAVYERDDFDYAYGTASFLRHRPATGDRGQVVMYYAVAELTGGSTPFVVLTPDEVKELRGGTVGPSGRIADPQHWMERKTVMRQLLKRLPKSTTLSTAIYADERIGAELYADRMAEVGGSGRAPAALPPPPDPEQEQEPRSASEAWAAAGGDQDSRQRMTPRTRAKLFAVLNEAGITTPEAQRAAVGDIVGRTIESRGTITQDEASQVIQIIEQQLEVVAVTPPEPPAEEDGWPEVRTPPTKR